MINWLIDVRGREWEQCNFNTLSFIIWNCIYEVLHWNNSIKRSRLEYRQFGPFESIITQITRRLSAHVRHYPQTAVPAPRAFHPLWSALLIPNTREWNIVSNFSTYDGGQEPRSRLYIDIARSVVYLTLCTKGDTVHEGLKVRRECEVEQGRWNGAGLPSTM